MGIFKLTIGRGQSVSNAIDCSNDIVVGLIMPPAWTPGARVSILMSVDNLNFHDLFSFDNAISTTAIEFQFNVVPNAIVAIDPNRTLMSRWIKLRSGTRTEPVPQAAGRSFTVITVQRDTPQLPTVLPVEMRDEADSDEVV